MNNLLSALSKVCRDYPLQEKILLVPSLGAGQELGEALARAGGGWVNLHAETPAGLAHRIAGAYLAEKNINLLSGPLLTAVVEEVFRKLEREKALQYFRRKGNAAGLIGALAAAIAEMRSCGVTSDNLSRSSFVSPAKGQDLLVLLKAYECYLQQHHYLDPPGLYLLALQLLTAPNAKDEAVYLLPSFMQWYPLEIKLIKTLAAARLRILETDPVYGINRPGAERTVVDGAGLQAPRTEAERLPWLYCVELAPPVVGDGSLNYFQAYGLRNEVREVFRQILAEDMRLDTVTVAYTSAEYIPVFYALARRLGVGLTIAEGIPGVLTGPGKVFGGLVAWMRHHFSATIFKELILSGTVRFYCGKDSKQALSPVAAARLLRSAGIGWGKDRYQLLQKLAVSLKEKAGPETENAEEMGRREQLLQQSRQAEQLYQLITPLLAALPAPDVAGEINFREFTSFFSQMLAQLARVNDENDAAALQGLVTNLSLAGQIASFTLEWEQALERVENILKGFRVGASGSRPGHLHLVSYENLIWCYRPDTFVVGLDASTFPGNSGQDPVLLDVERERIHSGLFLSADRPEENQYRLALALASRRGRVTFSFPSFDLVQNRLVHPSPVLLQVHRLLKGDSTLDYTDLMQALDKPAGFCPKDGTPALDEVEWWTGKVLNGPGIRNGAVVVRSCYPGLAWGHRAREAREDLVPTAYDGIIEVEAGQLDPRRNRKLVMSSSKLEALAGCPFVYFLEHILQISPPEKVVYDPGAWLHPYERGLLLHKLFCNFLKKITENNERPGREAHKTMLMEMADELLADYKQRIPVPSEAVYQYEVSDIYRCCEVFLATEETDPDGMPVLFEMPFGFGPQAVKEAGGGLAEPVKIELDDGTSFFLNGKIDRIDRVGAGGYRVWDYKTGSSYGYDDHRFLCGGRQIQHALYAMAAERILGALFPGETPRVETSGYYFPTERGEGLRVARSQLNRGAVYRALKNLLDIIGNGSFMVATHGEKCNICDYAAVCGGDQAVARAKQLLEAGTSCLEPWRRLINIE